MLCSAFSAQVPGEAYEQRNPCYEDERHCRQHVDWKVCNRHVSHACHPLGNTSLRKGSTGDFLDMCKEPTALRQTLFAHSLIRLEYGCVAIQADQQDVIRHVSIVICRTVHTWRANWHARDRQSNRVWTLPQQSPNLTGRNMAIKRIALNKAGVTGGIARWHADFLSCLDRVFDVVYNHFETVVPQMQKPIPAASTRWCLPDLNLGLGCSLLCPSQGRQKHQSCNDGTPHC